VGIGYLTKQLAQQALGEAQRPPDLSSIAEKLTGAPSGAGAQPDNVGATIVGQLQAMQKALKEEDELVVVCSAGGEIIRVLEVFAPTWRVLVLTGIDTDKNVARVVTTADQVQLVCKALPAPEGAKPVRLRIIVPKPKE
jgi:hypothetical protein